MHPTYKLNEYGIYETARQTEVRLLIMQGLSNRQIGDQLGIKEKSVKWLTGMLLKNWGVKSRMKLMARVIELDRMSGKYSPDKWLPGFGRK